MKTPIHFIRSPRLNSFFPARTACGNSTALYLTPDVQCVTCASCRKTIYFQIVRSLGGVL